MEPADRHLARPLPVEHSVYSVAVEVEMLWGTYKITCPECGADRNWVLCVQNPPWTTGERAWAQCPLQHTVRHPLIYPQVVHTLITWVNTAEPRPRLSDELSRIGWHPHCERWSEDDLSLPADRTDRVWHESWSTALTGHGYWEAHWPGLVEAAATLRSQAIERGLSGGEGNGHDRSPEGR